MYLLQSMSSRRYLDGHKPGKGETPILREFDDDRTQLGFRLDASGPIVDHWTFHELGGITRIAGAAVDRVSAFGIKSCCSQGWLDGGDANDAEKRGVYIRQANPNEHNPMDEGNLQWIIKKLPKGRVL